MTLDGRDPRRVFRRDAASRSDTLGEIDEELRTHLEWVAAELVSEGWTEAEALAEARRRFGDLEATRAYCASQAGRIRRRERWTMWWDDLLQDLKYAMRTLRRAPVWSLVVIATLAVGIASNTIVFSLMNPYLFRPLPFQDADRLVQLGGVDPVEGWDGGRFSVPQIEEIADGSRTLEAVGGYYYGTVNLTGGDQAERLLASWSAGPLFDVLGVSPILGRTFTPEEARGEGESVVVIGERLWETRFGRDPGVLGATLDLDGTPTTVIGVMPAVFTFPFGGLHLWMPMPSGAARADRTAMYLLPVARMSADATPDAVAREVGELIARTGRLHPDADGQYDGVSAKGLREALNFAWDVLPIAFGLLLGAVVMVLVIACVNVASLTLARAGSRGREVAVRAAVGADRARLVRQFVTESLVLALVGGALGVGLATLAMRVLNSVLPPDLFRVGDVGLDLRVLAFSAVVTLTTPILFGLLPAWRVARGSLASSLKDGGRGGSGRRNLRTRRILVVAEVTLALVLVTGTGLMVRSLGEVLRVDLGFESDGMLTVVLTPPEEEYPGAAEIDGFWRAVEAAVAGVAEVDAVGATSHLPLNHETIPVRYASAASAEGAVTDWPGAFTSRVDGDWFDAVNTPLRAGRTFTPDDVDGDALIVSEEMARHLFGSEDAVGRTLLFGSGSGDTEPARGTIVGVVGDVRFSDLSGTERPHLYRPLDGTSVRRRFLTLRTRGDAADAVPGVREALRSVAPRVPAELRPMSDVVLESTLLWSVSSLFLGIFGVVALGLAALGIYGLIAYSVMQRRREMGLRLALGADAGQLQRDIVVEGLRLTGIGVAIGLAVSVLGGMQLEAVLFGVDATDPVTLGGALALFGMVAIGASLLPARSAARTDPVRVLRDD